MALQQHLHWHDKSNPGFRKIVRQSKGFALSTALHLGFALLRALPFAVAFWLADRAAWLLYWLLVDLREISDRNLIRAFGETLTAEERASITRGAVRNVARNLVEVAKFDRIRAHLKDLVEANGEERLLSRREETSIVFTGHCGNWEILGAYFGLAGLNVAAVARRFYVGNVKDLLVAFRAANGVKSILREDSGAAREILKLIKGGGVLALLIDQDTHVQLMTMPYFGHPARTPVAPVTLALRRNVPLMAAFIEHLPGGRHRITVDDPLPLPRTGDEEADLRAGLELMNRRLEEHIRRCPGQWVWWHKRWARAPIPNLDLDGDFQYSGRQSTSPPDRPLAPQRTEDGQHAGEEE